MYPSGARLRGDLSRPMVGLFGGSFDPVHHGHLIVARRRAETLELDSLRFVPAREQPFKAATTGPRPSTRGHAGARGGRVTRLRRGAAELERPGPSYTVDTLRALHEREPGERLTLLVGADAAAELPAWHRRRRSRARPPGGVRPRRLGGSTPPLITVTIRCRPSRFLPPRSAGGCARAAPIRYWVPDAVAEYIDPHQLYLGPSMIKKLMTAVFGTRLRARNQAPPAPRGADPREEERLGLGRGRAKAQTGRFRERLAERTGARQGELERSGQAKHRCADPVGADRWRAGSRSWTSTRRS